MIPVGTQYQNVRQLHDDLEELLAPELGKFPNSLPAIWVEDRQARTVSGGVICIIQEDFVPTATRARMGNQSDTSGEWVVVLRSFGTPEQFRMAKEKMRSLPQSMRETALPFREGVVPQCTFRIQATITRNTWQ
jgi:hypothetical protein